MTYVYQTYRPDDPTLDPSLLGLCLHSEGNGEAEGVFEGSGSDEFTWVTVARTEAGELAGVHTFEVYDEGAGGLFLRSYATWVSKDHRRKGIGSDLWRKSLEETQVRGVDVCCISHSSIKMISSLEKEYPQLEWQVYEGAGNTVERIAA